MVVGNLGEWREGRGRRWWGVVETEIEGVVRVMMIAAMKKKKKKNKK